MDEKKPIRRHSKPRYFLINAGYYGKRFLCFVIALFFVCLALVIGVLTLCLGCLLGGVIGGILEVLASGITNLYRLYEVYNNLAKGSFLDPLPPAPNEILPEAEILVRASTPANSATLLRAASGNPTDDAPAVLLRASNLRNI